MPRCVRASRSLVAVAGGLLATAAIGVCAQRLLASAYGAARAAAKNTAGGPFAPPSGRDRVPVRYRPVGCRVPPATTALRSGPHRREVALTFDDGPATDTPQFLTALERLHVQATFFMIGDQVAGHSAVLARELRDGDVLGNHTFTHPFLTRTGDPAAQLGQTNAVIERESGYRPCLFRPPYGAYDSAVVQTARSQGLVTVLWNDDPSDYSLPGTGTIVSRVLAQVGPGSIVIMHDGGGPRGGTLAALPRIVSALRARRLRPVTLLALLGGHTAYRRCRTECGRLGVRGPPSPGSIVEPGLRPAHRGHAARPLLASRSPPALRPAREMLLRSEHQRA